MAAWPFHGQGLPATLVIQMTPTTATPQTSIETLRPRRSPRRWPLRHQRFNGRTSDARNAFSSSAQEVSNPP